MQINFGTQWDVVSIGCTGCIKINFADGVVLFLAVHYGAILIYWKKNEILLWLSKHLKWNQSDYENFKVFFYGMLQLFAHYISC